MECKKCGSNRTFIRESGIHLGAYCEDCGSWICWVSRKDAEGMNIRPSVEAISKEEHASYHRFNSKIADINIVEDGRIRSHMLVCDETDWSTTMVDGVTVCCGYDAGIDENKINFCPVCGRLIRDKR